VGPTCSDCVDTTMLSSARRSVAPWLKHGTITLSTAMLSSAPWLHPPPKRPSFSPTLSALAGVCVRPAVHVPVERLGEQADAQ